MFGPSPAPNANPNDEVVRRSLALSSAQRIAAITTVVGLVAIAHWTGWMTLVPLILTMSLVVFLRRARVQRYYGVAASYTVWVVGTVGMCVVGLIADGPVYYMAPLFVLPTILGVAVFPVRQIPWMAFAITVVVLATCWFADPAAFRDDPAPSVVSAVLLGAVVLITGMARRAETDSFLESRIDPLTGAHNRLALDEHMEDVPAAQQSRPWTLIVADIDHFKALNDRYGHAAGDRALREVAEHIRQLLPSHARLYRFGGEEFLISLWDCDPTTAARLARRIRVGIANLDLGGPTVTMSFGIASTPAAADGRFDMLFARADEAMYRAKESGRNAVVVAPTLATPSSGTADDEGQTWAPRRTETDDTPKGNLIQGWFEREHMVDLMTRQYASSRFTDALIIVPLIAFATRLGYATSLLAIAALLIFRAAQANLRRMSRPELLFAPAWVGAQALVTLAAIQGDDPWGLFVIAFLIVSTAAAVPWRLMRWGCVISALLIVAAALSHQDKILTSAPQSVVAPLLLLITCAAVGRELGRRIMAMRRASLHDRLTGLPNRSALDRRLADALDRAARQGGHVTLIMADIDHFKRVNDTFGHGRGDAVLITTTSRLQSRLRQSHAIHRVGGEEFAILLPGVHEGVAVEIATRLRAAVAEGPVSGIDLTMSFGVATGDGRTHPDDLYREADAALYRAKRSGRNRVERASETGSALIPLIPRRENRASR